MERKFSWIIILKYYSLEKLRLTGVLIYYISSIILCHSQENRFIESLPAYVLEL